MDVSPCEYSVQVWYRCGCGCVYIVHAIPLILDVLSAVASEQSFFVVAEVSAIHGRSLLEGSANKTRNVFDPITFTDDGPPPATDYNADANEIFWTSKSNRSILKASASGGPSSVLFQLEDGSYPTSLAVDWITGNIYYTTSRGQIAIVRGDGSYNAILIDQPSGNFSSLAVSPLTG